MPQLMRHLDIAQAISQDCQAVICVRGGRLQVVVEGLPQCVDVPAASAGRAPVSLRWCAVHPKETIAPHAHSAASDPALYVDAARAKALLGVNGTRKVTPVKAVVQNMGIKLLPRQVHSHRGWRIIKRAERGDGMAALQERGDVIDAGHPLARLAAPDCRHPVANRLP